MANRTTINIDKELRKDLNALKKYKRETYDETLRDLINEVKKRGVKK